MVQKNVQYFSLAIMFVSSLICAAPKKEVAVGDIAPKFALNDETGQEWSLSRMNGQKVVLWFHPGGKLCKREAAVLSRLKEFGIQVLGINYKSDRKNSVLKEEYGLSFPLLTDNKKVAAKLYDCFLWWSWFPKRATFIVDESGVVVDKIVIGQLFEKDAVIEEYVQKIIDLYGSNDEVLIDVNADEATVAVEEKQEEAIAVSNNEVSIDANADEATVAVEEKQEVATEEATVVSNDEVLTDANANEATVAVEEVAPAA